VWFDRYFLQAPHGNEMSVRVLSIAILIFVLLLLFSGNVRDYYHDR
jgi:hypothetical protein